MGGGDGSADGLGGGRIAGSFSPQAHRPKSIAAASATIQHLFLYQSPSFLLFLPLFCVYLPGKARNIQKTIWLQKDNKEPPAAGRLLQMELIPLG
jgi:hypothetical protein